MRYACRMGGLVLLTLLALAACSRSGTVPAAPAATTAPIVSPSPKAVASPPATARSAAPSPSATGKAGTSVQPSGSLASAEIFCPTDSVEAEGYFDQALDLEKSDPEQAEQFYRRAIALDPRYCDAMDNLAIVVRRQGRLDEAISWYTRSLAILPTNSVALGNVALVYAMKGDVDRAITTYKTLIQISPANPEGYYGLGKLYYEPLKRPQDAIPYLQKADEIYIASASPYAADAEYLLGFCYYVLNDYTRARTYLDPVYSLYQNDGGINYVLGSSYLLGEPKDLSLAKRYITKAKQLGAPVPDDVLKQIEGAP